MIIENRPIPEIWKNKPTYLKVLKKVLKNEDMKNIAVSNIKNNILKEEYNNNLKENLEKILEKFKSNSKYEYDNDLMTLVNNRKSNIKTTKRYKSLNEEYNNIIKKQNIKIELPRPDSIKENLKNILDYRKKLALRFKYNNDNMKNYKLNSALHISRSQVWNSVQRSKYNTISTSNDNNNKPIKGYNNIYSYNHKNSNDLNILENNLINKNKTIKEYEDKFMITGMNNKQFKSDIIEEENSIYNGSDNNRISNVKKSKSVIYY